MKKIICHIDVNSAFLSWSAVQRLKDFPEQQDLREIPSAVCGDKATRRGIILAKSIPAKAFGIKTGEPLFQAQKKCPKLVTVPPDYPLYVENSRKLLAILREVAPVVEQFSIDEAWIDLTGTEKLYGPPVQAAYMLKDRIREELGFTVNVGVANNKILAKIAGDFEKPDKVHTLFEEEIAQKLWPLPVRDMFYVGRQTEEKLHRMGIRTIGELAKANPNYIRQQLHKPGEMLWHYANGRGEDELQSEAGLNKSYGASTTTPQDVTTTQAAHKVLLSLAETVAMRLRQDKQSASCVTVHFRSSDFVNFSQQVQLAQPTDSTSEIYQAACTLFDQMWKHSIPLRQLGVYMSKVSLQAPRQYTLFGSDDYEKQSRRDVAVDNIRKRFGEEAIIRSCFLEEDGVTNLAGGLGKAKRNGLTKPLEDE